MAALDVVYLLQRDASLLRATDIALVLSLVFALGSVTTGYTDWNETYGNERRLGILHGSLMTLITVGYTHAGGPLDEGELVGSDRSDITCPLHASVFSMKSGAALHGPATMDEPAFDTRIAADGRIEVKARGSTGH